MLIVPTDVPMTAGLCAQTVRALTQAYPRLRSRVLTRTAFGREVLTLTAGRGPRRVLLSAAHHANEWITAPLILKFMEELAAAVDTGGEIWGVPAGLIDETVTIYTVPMVNPDGVDLVTGGIGPDSPEYRQAAELAAAYPDIPFPEGWKANLLGVDLNLQYPAGWLQAREIKFSQGFTRPGPRDYVGRAPLDQPESRALAQWTLDLEPALAVAWHTQGQVIYWQFADIEVPGARALAEEFSRVSGYTLEDVPYASAFAGYKDWFIKRFGRPGFTVEAGLGENPLPLSQFDQIYKENLGILVTAALGLPGGA